MLPYFGYPYAESNKKKATVPVTPIPPAAPPVQPELPPVQPELPPMQPVLQPEQQVIPQVQPVPQPVMQPVPQPIPQPVMQPVPMPIPQPVMQPALMPFPQPMPQPIMPPVTPICPFMSTAAMCGMYNMPDMSSMYGMEGGDPAAITSDPPPVLSNNPPAVDIVLFKELTGYPNYGNPSGNADILYTGNRGAWTFPIPPVIGALGTQRSQIVIRAVLDDHTNVPVNRYSARITINGTVVHNGPVPLEHGTPVGGRFVNWRPLTFNIRNLRRDTRVVIENTSTGDPNNWIAIDWMELRIIQR